MNEKTLELKKIIEVKEQNTYEKKNKKITIPEALISTEEKQAIKEKPIQRMKRFGTRLKNKNYNNRPCRSCGAPNWSPIHKCPALEINYYMRQERTLSKSMQAKVQWNRTVKRLTEEEMNAPDEPSYELDDSIQHIKEIKEIEETNKQTLHSNSRKKWSEKRSHNDTGSLITIMPTEKRKVEPTEIQKVTNRYQDGKKNEVKLQG